MSLTSAIFAAATASALVTGAATSAQAAIITLEEEGTNAWGSPVLERDLTYTVDGTSVDLGTGQIRSQDLPRSVPARARCGRTVQVQSFAPTPDTIDLRSSEQMNQAETFQASLYDDVNTLAQVGSFQLASPDVDTERPDGVIPTGVQATIAKGYLNGLNAPAQPKISANLKAPRPNLVSGDSTWLASVPLPFSSVLLLTGLFGLNGIRRHKTG